MLSQNGVTARDVARTFGRNEIYQLLEDAMMQLKEPDQIEQQPIEEQPHQQVLLVFTLCSVMRVYCCHKCTVATSI